MLLPTLALVVAPRMRNNHRNCSLPPVARGLTEPAIRLHGLAPGDSAHLVPGLSDLCAGRIAILGGFA
jgi:hypothetical protein